MLSYIHNLNFMSILDDLQKIKEVDKENLADLMAKLPEQMEKVWQERDKINPPTGGQSVKNVVITGMGCDRVTADVVKKSLEEISPLPIEVVGDYKAASYINEETLVVALSYSGQTPEVLSFIKELLKLKNRPKIFTIVGGGELEDISKKEKIPFYKFSGVGPSRVNIGYLLFALILLLEKIGLLGKSDKNFPSLIETIKNFNQQFIPQKETKENFAKNLAYQIFDRAPIVLGAEHLWPVAQRFKKLFNENAKNFAFAEEAPEFFHNSVVGIDHPFRLKDETFFIFLESDFYSEKTRKALSIFKESLFQEKINCEVISYSGKNKLEEAIKDILLGDWATFYLAILNKVDPTPMEMIESIKKQLKDI